MALIHAGTAFNQVIELLSDDKRKNKTVYGPLVRATVNSIVVDVENDTFFYSTAKAVNIGHSSGETNEVAKIYSEQKIIKIELDEEYQGVRFSLSNGGIQIISTQLENEEMPQPIILWKGDNHNKYTGTASNLVKEQYLFFGKEVVPYVVNLTTSLISWRGKNVKHDQLDLEVPINDIDGAFIRDQNFLAILNAENKLRLYDIRGTHRRPVNDLLLKTTPKARLTKMKISDCENYFFVSNDIGEIFQLDCRKDWGPIGKFKGIATTVTDFDISDKLLVAGSLDSYVRVFELESRKLISKHYMNKPIHSLHVSFIAQNEQQGIFQEEEVDLEQEQQVKANKVKQLRKRNKVGLKYLEPREFDEPEVKQEEERVRQKWYAQLNPIDRKQFEQYH